MIKRLLKSLVPLLVVTWVAALLIWMSVPSYPPVQSVPVVCDPSARTYPAEAALRVWTFNVQYMAGRGYVFFYDVEGGPDVRPDLSDVHLTINAVSELLRQYQPDVVFLQELNDEDDSRTHYVDQLAELQSAMGEERYPCHVSAHYWKVGWLPHPRILGSVSMQLTTLSRYRLATASRHQLPLMDNDPLTKHFYFQRAILQSRMARNDGGEIALLNTHLDAWGHGSDLMRRQVGEVSSLLQALDRDNIAWVLGGDFNVLPPDGGLQWQGLQSLYDRQSPLSELYQRYQAEPSLSALTSPQALDWYTYFPNDPAINAPDRTIDYLFFSHHWQVLSSEVLSEAELSDHLPVIARIRPKSFDAGDAKTIGENTVDGNVPALQR